MRAVVTPDDLKRGDLVEEAGWYPAEITKYEEKPAETDGSTNCIFSFKILEPEKYKGISPNKLFSEKALGFGKNLWKSMNVPFDKAKGYELSSELFQSFVNKKVKIYVKRGKSNKGNEFNDIADFQPMS